MAEPSRAHENRPLPEDDGDSDSDSSKQSMLRPQQQHEGLTTAEPSPAHQKRYIGFEESESELPSSSGKGRFWQKRVKPGYEKIDAWKISDDDEVEVRKTPDAAKERALQPNVIVADLLTEENRGMTHDISTAEVQHEDAWLDSIKVDPQLAEKGIATTKIEDDVPELTSKDAGRMETRIAYTPQFGDVIPELTSKYAERMKTRIADAPQPGEMVSSAGTRSRTHKEVMDDKLRVLLGRLQEAMNREKRMDLHNMTMKMSNEFTGHVTDGMPIAGTTHTSSAPPHQPSEDQFTGHVTDGMRIAGTTHTSSAPPHQPSEDQFTGHVSDGMSSEGSTLASNTPPQRSSEDTIVKDTPPQPSDEDTVAYDGPPQQSPAHIPDFICDETKIYFPKSFESPSPSKKVGSAILKKILKRLRESDKNPPTPDSPLREKEPPGVILDPYLGDPQGKRDAADIMKDCSKSILRVYTDETNERARRTLVYWLFLKCEKYMAVDETEPMSLAVNILDTYFSTPGVPSSDINSHSYAAACLLLASKHINQVGTEKIDFEDLYNQSVRVTPESMYAAEVNIFKARNSGGYNGSIDSYTRPLLHDCFMELNLMHAAHVGYLCSFLEMLALVDLRCCVEFKPTEIAASIVFVALFTVNPTFPPWTVDLVQRSGYWSIDLYDCVAVIRDLQMGIRGKDLASTSIRVSYSMKGKKAVSKFPIPSEIPMGYFK